MAQQGPNPIEVYQGAAQALTPTIAVVNANQLGSSTPCSEWAVQNLIKHNINVQTFVHATLAGIEFDHSTMFQVDGPFPARRRRSGF